MTATHPSARRLRPLRFSMAMTAALAMMIAPALAGAPTRTILSVSPNPVQYGAPVTMTATVITDATNFGSGPGNLGGSGNHTCARILATMNWGVACWGSNSDGQLGDGTITDSLLPVSAKTSDVVSVTAGGRHSCAVRASGTEVVCWGANGDGQLGDGTITGRTKADPVKLDSTTPLSNVSAVSAGDVHTCALMTSFGEVRCWGDNTDGELGDGTKTGRVYATQVMQHQSLKLSSVIAISAGYRHTCVVRTSGGGTVWCWGSNKQGQLGNGTQTQNSYPVQVNLNGAPLTDVTAIAAGGYHTCAITSTGSAYCWGRGLTGQLGQGGKTSSTSAVQVKDGSAYITGATAIAAGENHSCAIKDDDGLNGGEVRCWGEGDFGRNGNASPSDAATGVPVVVENGVTHLDNVLAISAGVSHTCALVLGGRARCWGGNEFGQVADGSTGNRITAVSVQKPVVDGPDVSFNVEAQPPVLLGTTSVVSGKATLANATLGGGSLVLTATYAGDGTYNLSKSSAISVLVNNAPTNDVLTGSSGDDTLDGGAGADKMTGMQGDDTYYVDNPGDVVEEKSNEGNDTIYSSVSFVLPSHVENLVLTGGAPISGTGNELDNIIKGNAAANTLQGSFGSDQLDGGSGNEILDGGDGADTMTGGAGDDVFVVDSQSDLVVETANGGEDTIRTALGYTLPLNVERLELTGVASVGGSGNARDNWLTGNAGANQLSGLDGDDVIEGGPGADILNGGSGIDTLSFAESKAGVTADLKMAVIDGDKVAEFENLRGSGFADRLTGDDGANMIEGGGGDDIIAGRKGKDALFGGPGKDRFAYFAAADSKGKKADIIWDFSVAAGDRIDLSKFDGDLRKKGRQRFTSYRGSKKFTKIPGQLRFSKGALLGDSNGDGKPDFKVVLKGVKKLPKKALKLK